MANSHLAGCGMAICAVWKSIDTYTPGWYKWFYIQKVHRTTAF